MARQFKIEIEDGVNYEFYLHDDGKIEMLQGIEPLPLSYYQRILDHSEHMGALMGDTGVVAYQITKV